MSTGLLDSEDQQFLLKKLWCHGQLFAPIQGLLISCWAFVDLRGFSTVYAVVAAPLLFLWCLMSWRCMQAMSPAPRLLVKIGLALELYYLGIIITCFNYWLSSTLTTVVLVVTALQVMETAAFLTMVNCLRDSINPVASRDGLQYDHVPVEDF